MAFFQLVLKAKKLEKLRQKYEDEKFSSIEISRGAKPRYTLRQRIRRKKLRCKKRVKDFWGRITSFPEDSWFHKKSVALRTDGTFENYILKSVFGFLGGIILTYIFFIFFVFQLKFSLASATTFCSLIGATLSLGLAFSLRVRCIVFLLLPQFFSKRGRQALMAYAFILALTGPARNTLHNIGVLTESLACGQEQLKEAVKAVIDLIKEPFYALRDAISRIIKTVKAVVKKIKQTLVAIKRLVLSILRVIVSVFEWLGSIVNICNKKLGTPFDRCQKVFEGAVADCKAKLGPILGVICNLTHIVGALCYVVKPLDFICMLVSYVADSVVDAVKRKIKKFTMRVKAMFYVKVKFSHSFHFETNQSKTIGDVSREIITEIRTRADEFRAMFDWMSVLTTFFAFFILLRVVRYRHKWLTNDRFDNRYLTDDLRTIDLIRARQDKETVLPLNSRERNRYVPLSSVGLIKPERLKLARTMVLLGLATYKLLVYIAVDYCLYWILYIIQYHGRFQSKMERPTAVGVHVSGNGYLAELYRSIVKAFTPSGKEMEVDTIPCLPDPIPPDFDRYTQIVTLIGFCWMMAFLEPYGLRLRHVVMCSYYPARAKQRAAWLYNHIIRSRGNFLKFARRQLRRKFGTANGAKIEKVTLRERLQAVCPILNRCFPLKQKVCLLCGAVERSEQEPHIKCPTPGCVGLFCVECFAALQNLCTVCRSPLDYGDLSDLSEEKDSSEDQLMAKRLKAKLLKKGEAETDKEKEGESSYDYTYQDESPGTGAETRKVSFKDLEAQRIRDDVTTQIFREPIDKTTSSDETTSSLPERRAKRTRAKSRRAKDPRDQGAKGTDTSSSIADTESWPTEELEEEEVVHTELDDTSEELLARDRTDKRKRGCANKLVARIPWPRRHKRKREGGNARGPSVMSRIGNIFGRKSRKSKKAQREAETVSSSSISSGDENKSLIREKGGGAGERKDRYDSSSDTRNENADLEYKKFATKEMPRYARSVSNETSYFEIDETESSRTIRPVEEVNSLSGARAALRNRRDGTWNITRTTETQVLYPCEPVKMYGWLKTRAKQLTYVQASTGTSEITQDTDKSEYWARTGTVSETTGSDSEPGNTCVSRNETEENTETLATVSRETEETSSEQFTAERQIRKYKRGAAGRRSGIPVIKKYLPIYQNRKLIEELKSHDRIRLIREREARRWRDSTDSSRLRSGDRVPLISLSKEADRSREVRQLFPAGRRQPR